MASYLAYAVSIVQSRYNDFVAKRGRTIPVPEWWLELAKEKSPGQQALAELIGPILGTVPTQATISRCLSGESSTLEMVGAISEALRIPKPVFFAESASESLAFETAKRLYSADISIAAAKADSKKRQTDQLSTEHDISSGNRARKR